MKDGPAIWAFSLLLAAASLTACASGGAGSTAVPFHTVALDRSDQGTTTDLSVGDHLALHLGTLPSGTWRLVTFPRGALALIASDPGQGRFEFRARAPGGGGVIVRAEQGCGPTETVPCKSPEEPVDAVSGVYPPRPFEVMVEVS